MGSNTTAPCSIFLILQKQNDAMMPFSDSQDGCVGFSENPEASSTLTFLAGSLPVLDFCVGSVRPVALLLLGSSCPRQAATSLQEWVGDVGRLVRLLAELWERCLHQDAHLHHKVMISRTWTTKSRFSTHVPPPASFPFFPLLFVQEPGGRALCRRCQTVQDLQHQGLLWLHSGYVL